MKATLYLLLCTTTISFASAAQKEHANAKEKVDSVVIDLIQTTQEFGDGMGEGKLIGSFILRRSDSPTTPSSTPFIQHDVNSAAAAPDSLASAAAQILAADSAVIAAPTQLQRQRSNSLSDAYSPTQTTRTLASHRRNSLPTPSYYEELLRKKYLDDKKKQFAHSVKGDAS